MRQRGSTSIKSSQSAAPDAVLALVRLLARHAAREFALHAPAPSDKKQPAPGDQNDRRPGFFSRQRHRAFDGTVAEDGEALDCRRDPASVKVRGARLVPRKGLERVLSPAPPDSARTRRRKSSRRSGLADIGKALCKNTFHLLCDRMPECHLMTPHVTRPPAPGRDHTMTRIRPSQRSPTCSELLDRAGLTATRRRDMVSAVKRICEMAGTTPAGVAAEPALLRRMLSSIRPAAHGISAKSYSNLRSLLAATLQLAGVIELLGPGRRQTPPSMGTPARGHR